MYGSDERTGSEHEREKRLWNYIEAHVRRNEELRVKVEGELASKNRWKRTNKNSGKTVN